MYFKLFVVRVVEKVNLTFKKTCIAIWKSLHEFHCFRVRMSADTRKTSRPHTVFKSMHFPNFSSAPLKSVVRNFAKLHTCEHNLTRWSYLILFVNQVEKA